MSGVFGILVTLSVLGAAACTVATFGACGAAILAAGMIGGIAAAGTTFALQPGPKSVQGAVQAMTYGAAGGLLGSAIGAAAGSLAGSVAASGAGKSLEPSQARRAVEVKHRPDCLLLRRPHG